MGQCKHYNCGWINVRFRDGGSDSCIYLQDVAMKPDFYRLSLILLAIDTFNTLPLLSERVDNRLPIQPTRGMNMLPQQANSPKNINIGVRFRDGDD